MAGGGGGAHQTIAAAIRSAKSGSRNPVWFSGFAPGTAEGGIVERRIAQRAAEDATLNEPNSVKPAASVVDLPGELAARRRRGPGRGSGCLRPRRPSRSCAAAQRSPGPDDRRCPCGRSSRQSISLFWLIAWMPDAWASAMSSGFGPSRRSPPSFAGACRPPPSRRGGCPPAGRPRSPLRAGEHDVVGLDLRAELDRAREAVAQDAGRRPGERPIARLGVRGGVRERVVERDVAAARTGDVVGAAQACRRGGRGVGRLVDLHRHVDRRVDRRHRAGVERAADDPGAHGAVPSSLEERLRGAIGAYRVPGGSR